jgi:class 3 adenylate cyclase
VNERLKQLCETLEETGWGALLYDADWTLVWVSNEAKVLLDETDDERLGIGRHSLEVLQRDPWQRSITEASQKALLELTLPYMAHDHPDGASGLRGLADEQGVAEQLAGLEPEAPPPVWTSTIDFVQGDLPPTTIISIGVRHEVGGELIGTSFIYGPHLPASVLSFVARGDEGMFHRIAGLIDPAQRPSAVLFADLRSSSELSRRLPSAGYFAVMREVQTAIDDEVIAHCGIVGKHVGDGATAFFLSEHLGSDSAAARAAVDTACKLPSVARAAAERVAGDGVPVDGDEVRLGVGTHWGAALYMGQIITGGRLEITALGDAVNEAARIEQSSQDGEILASKDLIERLGNEDAEDLGVDRDRLRYLPLAEMPGSDEKAERDAGSLAVTDLREALPNLRDDAPSGSATDS